jgi:perosamine synthetase
MGGNEGRYLQECVETNWVSSVGPFVDRFERETAAYLGLSHGVATASGTAALHLAMLAVGVRPGDEVVTSDLTFIAPANAARYAGAWPVFIDVDPSTWQMDVRLLGDFLRRCRQYDGRLVNPASGRPIGALLPVHILGHPVDMDPLMELAAQYGLPVVEDATESLGATYKGRKVGGFGRAACLSFNGNKLVTCGGGGMVVTGDESLAVRARHLSTQAKRDPVEYIHDEIGFNYRLTNLQAAVGCAQLETIDRRLAAKRRIAARYAEMCRGIHGLSFMPTAPWAKGAYWISTVVVDPEGFGMDSRDLLRYLAGHRVEARPLWQPLHLSPAHRGAETVGGREAERLHARGLSLPSSVGLTADDQEKVVAAVAAAARRA